MISSGTMNSQFINRSVTPVLVWTEKNPDEETREQVIANHERFRMLPPEAKYKLGFQYTPEIIKKIGEDFSLDPLKMASIARAVRNFYFGDLPKEKIEGFLMEEMEISSEQAQKIALIVDQKIISAPIPKDVSEQTVEIPLLDALSKYQRLSEQAVTEDRIVVKGEGQPVRGSIRNWLRHYRDVVGIRKHSAMERGQFLFQGENTKRLSAPDREKLSLLFRSLDENMPISIDVERQEVIFPAFEEKSNANQAPLEEKVTPTLGTSFRPIEKFPASSTPIKKALEWKTEKTAIPPLFGNVPAPPRPEITSSKSVGVSAPVYAIPPIPVSPSGDARAEGGKSGGMPAAQEGMSVSSPFSAPGNMSFSSSHVLPHEKAALPAEPPQEGVSSEGHPPSRGPEAISVIKPRGDQFGFRGKSSGDDFDAPRVVNLRG